MASGDVSKRDHGILPRVLILHTGGTLGMRGEPLEPDAFSTALTEAVPELEEFAELETRIIFNLDSSDIGPSHWTQLAKEIHGSRGDFDGFVVVHGTDTMAFTASALSYALRGLGKPVVLTGAQRPLAALRTDARRNLVDAVELATLSLDTVGICFDGLFLQGTRARKSDVHDYRAFTSPGTEPVARLGVDIALNPGRWQVSQEYLFRPDFDPAVLTVPVTPGMRSELLEPLLRPGKIKGLILAAFGLGTVPRIGSDTTEFVRRAVDQGINVMVITQSAGHIEMERYPNGRFLQAAGAISGGAMTMEAAVVKMMHGLANFEDQAERRAYLLENIAAERGE